MTHYNSIGIAGKTEEDLLARDCFAIYLIPGDSGNTKDYTELTVSGLEPWDEPGSLHLFFEQIPVAHISMVPGKRINAQVRLPSRLKPDSPYQVLGFFVPEGFSHLPPRTTGKPVVRFREIGLQCSTP